MNSLDWAKFWGFFSSPQLQRNVSTLLTVISMWRNLHTVRKQRPSCHRLQTVSLPIAASQCRKGQLSPCITSETQWESSLAHQPLFSCSHYVLACLQSSYFSAGGIVKEIAVISLDAHGNWLPTGLSLKKRPQQHPKIKLKITPQVLQHGCTCTEQKSHFELFFFFYETFVFLSTVPFTWRRWEVFSLLSTLLVWSLSSGMESWRNTWSVS